MNACVALVKNFKANIDTCHKVNSRQDSYENKQADEESAYQFESLGLFQGYTLTACLAALNCLKLSRKRALIGRLIPSWHAKAAIDRNCTTEAT